MIADSSKPNTCETPSVPVIQSITLRRRLIQLDAARGGRWSQVS